MFKSAIEEMPEVSSEVHEQIDARVSQFYGAWIQNATQAQKNHDSQSVQRWLNDENFKKQRLEKLAKLFQDACESTENDARLNLEQYRIFR